MSRQIKFRVWDKEDECWIDPSHLQVNADGYLYIPYGIAPEIYLKRAARNHQTEYVILSRKIIGAFSD